MNCHVCNKENTNNLSICPGCGAMMNDSVRAELLPKTSISKPLPQIDRAENAASSGKLIQSIADRTVESLHKNTEKIAAPSENIVEPKRTTANISAKLTSPTLVEFHSKNSSIPEWRVQLQNAVRQRQGRENSLPENFGAPVSAVAVASVSRKTKTVTNGANALKIQPIQEQKPAPLKNPTLNSALERIEKSRRKFYVEEEIAAAPAADASPRPASKNFPFYIASKQTDTGAQNKDPHSTDNYGRNENGDLDTNKLPPLASVINSRSPQSSPTPAKISTNFAKNQPEIGKIGTKRDEIVQFKPIEETLAPEISNEQGEDFEDCAPVAQRFNAGLFDLIIGAFLSLVLLAVPFTMTSAETNWFSFTGVLAFLATCSIVMFIYLTTTVSFYGRTFGMRLFSLEIVDIEGENYPTLHQSAVSAAVYLLSLAFAGAGFLTLFFNEDRRAAHDLLSGTIVVREI